MSELSQVQADVDGPEGPTPTSSTAVASPTSSSASPGRLEPSARAPLTWTLVRRPEQLAPWRPAIDELADRRQLPELAGGAWLSAFWEGFFPDDPQVEVQVLHRGPRLVAAIPVRTGGRLV